VRSTSVPNFIKIHLV